MTMDIIERLQRRRQVTPGGRLVYAQQAELNEAADEIERLRKWQTEACEWLVQGARYEYSGVAICRLLAEAGYEIPEWLTDG
jgi:hypothetical protein